MTGAFLQLPPIACAKAVNTDRVGDEDYVGTIDEKPAFNHSHYSPNPLL